MYKGVIMATTKTQDRDFINTTLSNLLEDSIRWINKNLKPQNVFDEDDLKQWAEDNGFEKKGRKIPPGW